MVFLLEHRRHDVPAMRSLPIDSPLAQPTTRALAGQSGSMVGVDYRGATVLAAYEPVARLGWATVVKMDLSEFRAPFLRAGLYALIASAIVVSLGTFAFVRIISPMIQQLRDSEQRLRRAVVDAPFPIMIHAEDGRVIMTSNVLHAITGYRPEEISTTSAWIEKTCGLGRDDIKADLNRVYSASGMVDRGEIEITTASGEKRIWHFRSEPLGQLGDGVRIIISMAMDVTDRKRAEQLIAAEHERLHVTLHSIGDAVITTDQEGRIAMMNRVAEQLTGWQNQEALSRPLGDVFHIINQNTRQPCENPVAKVFETGGIIGLANNTALISRDGTERIIADSGAPIIDAAGKITGVVLVFRDNTEIHQAHIALAEARERAEAANFAKDRFLAALSHELRTPLAPALVTVSMLQDDPRVGCVRDDIITIRRSIELEARLIDDLLDLTRIVQGKLRMNWQAVDVHEVLGQALAVAGDTPDSHRLEIRLEYQAQRCMVRADPARLEQVFWNVIKNAMQYTPEGGKLIIRTSNPDNATCEITFIDNGIGVEKEFLPRAFDVFQQGESAGLRRSGGLGLGLAICRSILQQLDGSAQIFSEGRDKGTTFTIRLPITSEKPEPAVPVVVAKPEADARLRILLVEDHAMTLKVMAKLLRGMGHEVTPATTVRAALDLAASRTFDLLVSDIGLPDGDGTDVMRWFAANRPVRGIALSGFGMDADIERSHQAGFATHLTKPVTPDLLKQTINHVTAVLAG